MVDCKLGDQVRISAIIQVDFIGIKYTSSDSGRPLSCHSSPERARKPPARLPEIHKLVVYVIALVNFAVAFDYMFSQPVS